MGKKAVAELPMARVERLEAKTEAQAHYLISMESNIITVGAGAAGTGKTYLAASLAAKQLLEKKVGRIIISRPAVESGRGLGFLPGKLEEKFDPYLAPVRNVLDQHLGLPVGRQAVGLEISTPPFLQIQNILEHVVVFQLQHLSTKFYLEKPWA